MSAEFMWLVFLVIAILEASRDGMRYERHVSVPLDEAKFKAQLAQVTKLRMALGK